MDGVAYKYDPNGNLLSDGANTYAYDTANRLTASNSVSYTYNGMGDRLQETVGGATTTFTMDLNTALTQTLSDGTNTYLYGIGRIAQVNTTSEYFLSDALGSVRQMAEDTNGEVTFSQNYDPYGVVTQTNGTSETTYGYTSEYTDPNGVVYLRARHYDPGMGRFLTKDTWDGNYNRPLSLNRWNYVEGNPVNLVDPSGRFPEWCKSMGGRLLYENCVRDYYNLSAPKEYSVMPQPQPDDIDEYGTPNCWRGPVAYNAPGYLEGFSFGGGVLINIFYANEVVYDFGTMEKQRFEIGIVGATTQLGVSFSEYHGIVFNLNNIDLLKDAYKGSFWYASAGAGTAVPAIFSLNTGVTFFHALKGDVWGVSQFYSFGVGHELISFPGGNVAFEGGFGYGAAGERIDTYIDQSTGKVKIAQLVSDITTGKDSPAIVPVPSVLVRGLGIELAYLYGWIYDEIHINSK